MNWLNKRKTIAVIALVAVAAGATITATLAIWNPSSPCASTRGNTRTFTIIGDLIGFNGSRNIPAPWPVINVERCDVVTIRFDNQDTQAHGLAVDFYSNRGVAPRGGETQTLTFTATKTGQFRFFCHIFCTVHIFMQDGQLNVS